MLTQYASAIEDVVLFEGLDSEARLKVMKCLNAFDRVFDEGEAVYMEGDAFNEIGIVLYGEICMMKVHTDGRLHEIGRVGKFETYGEDIICAGRSQAPYSLIATQKTRVVHVDGKKLVDHDSVHCKYRSHVNLNMLKRMAAYSVNINKKMEYMSILSLKKRVVTYLLDVSQEQGTVDFELSMNREEMARFLNATRPAISKILMQLKADGLLEYRKHHFSIRSKEKMTGLLNN